MATLLTTTTLVGKAGITDTLVAADATGNWLDNPGSTSWVEINNGSGSPVTVTIDCTATVDGNAVTDPTVAVPAGARRKIGPFNTGLYNDGSGRVLFTFSAVTSVTIGAFSL